MFVNYIYINIYNIIYIVHLKAAVSFIPFVP